VYFQEAPGDPGDGAAMRRLKSTSNARKLSRQRWRAGMSFAAVCRRSVASIVLTSASDQGRGSACKGQMQALDDERHAASDRERSCLTRVQLAFTFRRI
jgi:hypothetical protein